MPFDTSVRASAHLPRHLFLNLSLRVLRNISRFRLSAHKLCATKLNSRWRQQLGILGTLLYVNIVIVIRYKMRCMLS